MQQNYDGLVVPDVPLEETDILRKEALENNIELVLLTTPTTLMERMKVIAEASEGFLYLVVEIVDRYETDCIPASSGSVKVIYIQTSGNKTCN